MNRQAGGEATKHTPTAAFQCIQDRESICLRNKKVHFHASKGTIMNARRKNQTGIGFALSMGLVLALSWTSAYGDDLNPPDYRGDPLSVYAHWSADASGVLIMDQFSWVDDGDPATFLHPLQPSIQVPPPTSGIYQFQLPNIVDELPIKYMRVQLTWTGTTQPPVNVFSEAMDGIQLIPGILTYASGPLVFTQPDGGYQYFDFEFRPNPDFERINVQLPPDALLVQVVVDTVSTVPEPTTLIFLSAGALAMARRRRTLRN